MKRLKGVLAGAGAISSFHLQAWQRIPQAHIVAIADPNLQNAQARADEFKINRVYASLAALLQANPELEFVDIAAPPEAHLELVKLAAAHKLAINCQKQFAPSLAEARQMIDICREANVVLNINENWRWRTWHRTLKKLLAEGKIGRSVYARVFSHASFMVPNRLYNQHRLAPNHRFRHWQRVLFYDWGTHYIDILRFFFGEPVTVYARMDRLNPEIRGDDRALVILTFPTLTAVLDLSWSSFDPTGYATRYGPIVEELRIEGDGGTLSLVPENEAVSVVNPTEAWEQPAYVETEAFEAYKGSYVAAQSHFIDCLLTNTTPETRALDNYETLAATLAAYDAAEHNRVVNIVEYKKAH
jgi:predicted dehydrogenase